MVHVVVLSESSTAMVVDCANRVPRLETVARLTSLYRRSPRSGARPDGPSVQGQTFCLNNLYSNGPKAGETPQIKSGPRFAPSQKKDSRPTSNCTQASVRGRSMVMGQLMRQIAVVVGLTVILTFPVTVVSGAGSQKQSDSAVHSITSGKVRMHEAARPVRSQTMLGPGLHGLRR